MLLKLVTRFGEALLAVRGRGDRLPGHPVDRLPWCCRRSTPTSSIRRGGQGRHRRDPPASAPSCSRVTLVQIAASITAVYFGARTAMTFGRDVRGDLPQGRHVQRAGGVEVRRTIAITRSSERRCSRCRCSCSCRSRCWLSAPILAVGGVIFALQQDLQLSWLMAVAVPVLLVASVRSRRRPLSSRSSASCRPGSRRSQPGAAGAADRHPGDPRLRARAGRRPSASRRGEHAR